MLHPHLLAAEEKSPETFLFRASRLFPICNKTARPPGSARERQPVDRGCCRRPRAALPPQNSRIFLSCEFNLGHVNTHPGSAVSTRSDCLLIKEQRGRVFESYFGSSKKRQINTHKLFIRHAQHLALMSESSQLQPAQISADVILFLKRLLG